MINPKFGAEVHDMKATATEIKTHFGHYLDLAKKGEAIIVERSGKEAAAIMDYDEYRHLKRLDDLVLIEKIKQAEGRGYLNDAESENFFKTMLGRLSDDLETETE
jgi:prevent-host-death family protein